MSNVVEIASRWFSSSSGDCPLGAHRQLGQDTVLELRSVHQQAHKVSASVQRTPALASRHLEHKVQCAVSPLHPSSGVRPQPHSAEHRLQRLVSADAPSARPGSHRSSRTTARSTVAASERPSALRSVLVPHARTPLASAYDISLNCLRASEFSAFGFACKRTVAPLMTRSREHRIQRSPQTQRTVSHRQ